MKQKIKKEEEEEEKEEEEEEEKEKEEEKEEAYSQIILHSCLINRSSMKVIIL